MRSLLLLPAAVLAMPYLAFAQAVIDPDGGLLGRSLQNIISFVNGYIIPFILGIGFLFFVWGMFLYFIKGGASDEEKAKGKSLLIYAVAGFVLIFTFWGIVGMVASVFDTGPAPDITFPDFGIPGR